MSFKPELLALLIIMAFGVLLYLAIRTSRKITAEKNHQAQTMGFDALNEPPPQLASRVDEVFKRSDQKAVYIDEIFSKQEGNRELFIFDIQDSSDDDNEMGSEVFGMITSELDLPRFSLTTLPGFSSDSFLGGIMDKLLDKVLSLAEKYQGMSRIEIPNPDFGDQVIVFGSDEIAVRELMRGIHLSTLTRSQSPIHIAGKGDFITVDFSLPSSYGSNENDLISQFQHFTQISRSFMK